MLQTLRKPYPFREKKITDVALPIIIGIFVGLFLLVFRPFGLHAFTSNADGLKIFGYSLVTIAVTFIFLRLLPHFLINVINETKWTVAKEIIYINLMLIVIALGNLIYTAMVFQNSLNFNLQNAASMGMYTFLVGLLPITFLVMLNHSKLYKKNVKESESIQLDSTIAKNKVEQHIQVTTENDEIQINLDQLLYIESFGNYAKIFNLTDDQVSNILARTTMKNIEQQIQSDHIIRCHRSYIVNLDKVIDVKGNAQGFKLSLEGSQEIVPVSRKFVPVVKRYFNR